MLPRCATLTRGAGWSCASWPAARARGPSTRASGAAPSPARSPRIDSCSRLRSRGGGRRVGGAVDRRHGRGRDAAPEGPGGTTYDGWTYIDARPVAAAAKSRKRVHGARTVRNTGRRGSRRGDGRPLQSRDELVDPVRSKNATGDGPAPRGRRGARGPRVLDGKSLRQAGDGELGHPGAPRAADRDTGIASVAPGPAQGHLRWASNARGPMMQETL